MNNFDKISIYIYIFDYQCRVLLKAFPDLRYLRSEDWVVWQWHFLIHFLAMLSAENLNSPENLHYCAKKLNVFRSSRTEVFLGNGILEICSKFTGEHPCRNAISIELQSMTTWCATENSHFELWLLYWKRIFIFRLSLAITRSEIQIVH